MKEVIEIINIQVATHGVVIGLLILWNIWLTIALVRANKKTP